MLTSHKRLLPKRSRTSLPLLLVGTSQGSTAWAHRHRDATEGLNPCRQEVRRSGGGVRGSLPRAGAPVRAENVQQQPYRGGTASGIEARRPSSAGSMTFSARTGSKLPTPRRHRRPRFEAPRPLHRPIPRSAPRPPGCRLPAPPVGRPARPPDGVKFESPCAHQLEVGERGPEPEAAQKRRARAQGGRGTGRRRHRETEGHRGEGRGLSGRFEFCRRRRSTLLGERGGPAPRRQRDRRARPAQHRPQTGAGTPGAAPDTPASGHPKPRTAERGTESRERRARAP